jgi:hypothetical protein
MASRLRAVVGDALPVGTHAHLFGCLEAGASDLQRPVTFLYPMASLDEL